MHTLTIANYNPAHNIYVATYSYRYRLRNLRHILYIDYVRIANCDSYIV